MNGHSEKQKMLDAMYYFFTSLTPDDPNTLSFSVASNYFVLAHIISFFLVFSLVFSSWCFSSWCLL